MKQSRFSIRADALPIVLAIEIGASICRYLNFLTRRSDMYKAMIYIVLSVFFFDTAAGARETMNARNATGVLDGLRAGEISRVSREPGFIIFPVYADPVYADHTKTRYGENLEDPAIDRDEITGVFSYLYWIIHVPPILWNDAVLEESWTLPSDDTTTDVPPDLPWDDTVIEEPLDLPWDDTVIDEPLGLPWDDTVIDEPLGLRPGFGQETFNGNGSGDIIPEHWYEAQKERPWYVQHEDDDAVIAEGIFRNDPIVVPPRYWDEVVIDEPMTLPLDDTVTDEPMTLPLDDTVEDRPMELPSDEVVIEVPWVVQGEYDDEIIVENELIVLPPVFPDDTVVYEQVIRQVEEEYGIAIEVDDLNPTGIGFHRRERHFWNGNGDPELTAEIKSAYRNMGYRAYFSHAYETFSTEDRTDPYAHEQVPYPFGDDDWMGFTANDGGYLRVQAGYWPSDPDPTGEVLLVLSDTGLFWRYEDFIGNLWQNHGEDLDGDGTVIDLGGGSFDFDLDDLNGWDDDGNGYDDLIGYDFYGDSPDPTHYDGEYYTHGTSVYSVIASETHNGTGMRGALFPGFVKVVPTKVGEGLLIDEAAAIEGIYYAAYLQAQGYQVVLNMSWGGTHESEPLFQALDLFTDLGGLAVAAVGNTPDGIERYPAAWPNVVAVAATNIYNTRADFSNHGSWVDIAAPGEEILAAFYKAVNGSNRMRYAFLDGTSFAAPMVSSVAAMYWSIHPEWTAQDVSERLFSAVYEPEDYPWDPPGSWLELYGGPGGQGSMNPYYGAGILDSGLLFRLGENRCEGMCE